MRTTVGIIGAGPAGLLLARRLHLAGVDCVVLENRDRAYIERRQRAGLLEQGTVDALREAGAGARLDAEGLEHHGVELRFDGVSHRVDFTALAGRGVTVYAQTEIVKDLVALQLADGPPLLFGAEALAVEGADGDRPTVRYRQGGRESVLECDWVAGCDGFHGVARAAIPAALRTTHERDYPFSWLGILADAAPSSEELVYARGEHGFALLSMRSPTVSRLYLQVPNGTDPGDWPDQRIWDELDTRLASGGDPSWRLRRGAVTGKSVTPMRSFVSEPMRYGRLLLAGDAAHIVPPTGAKGLNLAVSDVRLLARAFEELHRTGSTRLLDAYPATALRRVWQATRFSYDMTTMLHVPDGQSGFDRRIELARLHRIAASRDASAEFAALYTGLPLD
ncbi:4-hydroxybenzoate 3-monooxygenase [Streptomyces montanisoli]|uniref:4-hydroxybenzoate 3-monooxygenase n=1 Tax=Streptomyces montanisoli TaxID=2798581 RepID=A0A940MAC9_9ACTN|nr:4-hydroxybenzoate 3-monooxygenase [Streptomyces montanisoli]MBP0456821.1 4-hydroxybenzoate 3-monooxygenase [Streptomyces montanisoli]